MANDGPSRVFTFWGMVGAVMVALKLKDRWNDYKQVSSEEDGLGPVALRSPVAENGEHYRDDVDGATLSDSVLDTEIPGARPKRKRSKDCCVCCGMQCGLFWKAFGIVCLIFFVWQVGKLIMWAVTPSPTGLENMPVYSEALGCLDAKHFYQDEVNTITVPLNPNKLDHSVDFRGDFTGTVVVAQGDADATEIKYEVTVRASNDAVLETLTLHHPSNAEIEDGTTNSQFSLSGRATTGSGQCGRYDIKMYLPPTLQKLHIQAHATSHILFDESSNIDLDSFFVTMYTNDQKNMLLPHPSIHAKEMRLEMTQGWLVGEASLVDTAYITTQRGDATTNVKVLPVPSLGDQQPTDAVLHTTTGAGRTDIFYISDRGAPHRPIQSKHLSSRNGDLYLTYKEAEFSGVIDLKAKSYTATGVQGMFPSNGTTSGELPWVGDKNGVDRLTVESRNGWVGLYF